MTRNVGYRQWFCGGFSLIEVSLAILLIGMGVLTLFSLFPAGLKQSDNAITDTHVGLFAEQVFNGVRGNASQITNWLEWADINTFRSKVAGANLDVEGEYIYGDGVSRDAGDISYTLALDAVTDHPDLRGANLKAKWKGRDEQWFYTEMFFQGSR